MRVTLPRLILGILMAMLGLLGTQASASAETPSSLRIVSDEIPPLSTREHTGFEDLLAKEIYRRIGIEIEITLLPAQRVLTNANAGIDDGIHARIGGLAERYPNLVQFEEPTMDVEYVAFSRRRDIEIAGWDSFRPYNVGIITGWKILEWNIKTAKSLTKVGTVEQLFQILDAGRVDVVVYTRWGGLYEIRELALEDVRILEPPLAAREIFSYLHKKHKHLIPRASAALREMKRDGTYQRIFDQTLGKLVPG